MKKVREAALMASADELEATFYEAMRQGDLVRLMSVWADDEEVACVHPGGPRVVGGTAIMETFEAIFSNGPVLVSIEQVRRFQSVSCAVHHVLERVQGMSTDGMHTAFVLATNVYVRSEKGWRMVLHHASPGREQDLPEVADFAATVH